MGLSLPVHKYFFGWNMSRGVQQPTVDFRNNAHVNEPVVLEATTIIQGATISQVKGGRLEDRKMPPIVRIRAPHGAFN